MDLDQKSILLKQMLSQVVSADVVASPLSSMESIGVSEPQAEAVKRGLESLSSDAPLEETDALVLEAIIHKKFRPAIFIVSDAYDTPPAPWEFLGSSDVQQRISQAIPSIGRVELPGMASVPFGGTAFIVGPNLMMTNRHVAEIFTSGLGTQRLVFKSNRTSAINFRREVVPAPQVQNVQVQRVVMIHPFWDMALLHVDGLTAPQAALKLSIKHPADLVERNVVVIGYPAQDSRSSLELQNEIFGGVFNVKRLQPGKLRAVRKIDSFGNQVDAVTHDASTLGGNSGSAVIDVETGEVVALHFAGLYLDANFAVPTYELARDTRVVDLGVNFTGSVAPTAAWAARWQVADAISEAMAAASPLHATSQLVPTSAQLSTPPSSTAAVPFAPTSPSVAAGTVTWTIPLQVSIQVGQTAMAVDHTLGSQAVTQVPGVQATGTQATGARLVDHIAEVEAAVVDEELQVVTTAYAKFSTIALQASTFSWPAALSCAAACHLAYENALRVLDVGRNQWSFATCDFVQVNDTECFIASDPNIVLVSFRGTAGTADWIRDLTFFSTEVEYGTVHRGFYAGFQQVRMQLEMILANVAAATKQLVITGHSLGGALATIAAAEWSSKYSIRNVYTFGQPAVGNRDFRDFINQNLAGRFQRFVNDDDIVPRVPPGYIHVGKLFHFDPQASVSNESVTAATAREEVAPMLSEVEFRILQEECHAIASLGPAGAMITEGLLPSFSDHSLFRYMAKIIKQLS